MGSSTFVTVDLFNAIAAPVKNIILYRLYMTPCRKSNILWYTGYKIKYFVPSRELQKTSIDQKLFFTSRCVIDFHAVLMGNFKHRVVRIKPTTVQRCAQEDLMCIAIKNRTREPGKDGKILWDTVCWQ